MIVFDASAFGGQAGASARIENYLGFPTGISGQALTGRAFVQAQKFGAEMAIPVEVTGLDCGASNEVTYHQPVNGALERTLIPSAQKRELKSLLQTGLKLFTEHENHAENLMSELK